MNYRNKNISKLPINNLRSNRQIQSNNINYYKNVINIKHKDKDNQKLNLSNHISNNQNKSMDSNRNNRENNNHLIIKILIFYTSITKPHYNRYKFFY